MTDRVSPVTRALLLPIRFYRRFISPALPPTCRFHPSCSAYAVEALTVHGPLRGSWLAIRRLGRCGPWHPGGLDPVPPRRTTVPDLPAEE
ncbi:membrane protein insertion efficiency factor YidD [Actinosynnema sp. CS-041913]|uniref:membrane protein insertion efficiency factor YidD n=1 Tax=Actinosynnema sp. CS-041913 TaxID=3239917 RepID=UPI003D8DCFC7